MTGEKAGKKKTRRELAKMGLFAIPVILSMSATPAFASRGSGGDHDGENQRQGGGWDRPR